MPKVYIYRLLNSVTGECYVGQSNNPLMRWQTHLMQLQSKNHGNPLLQKSWDDHGDVFRLDILETADFESSDSRNERKRNQSRAGKPLERKWVIQLKPTLNLVRDVIALGAGAKTFEGAIPKNMPYDWETAEKLRINRPLFKWLSYSGTISQNAHRQSS